MRGLAVFISDIRNCEWPRRRTRPAGGGCRGAQARGAGRVCGPGGRLSWGRRPGVRGGGADLEGGFWGAQARVTGRGVRGAGRGCGPRGWVFGRRKPGVRGGESKARGGWRPRVRVPGGRRPGLQAWGSGVRGAGSGLRGGGGDLEDGSPGAPARGAGGGVGDAGLGAQTRVEGCGSGSEAGRWQWVRGAGGRGSAEGVRMKTPLLSMMSSRAVCAFLVMEHLTRRFPQSSGSSRWEWGWRHPRLVGEAALCSRLPRALKPV